MSSLNRKLKFGLAINEALSLMLKQNEKLILLGQGVKSPWYVGSTCKDLVLNFGEERVIDTPVSENAMTGAALGASLSGNPTVIVHPRLDFMLYGLDPIINQAANWNYMNGNKLNAPVVFWGIINRGGEQGAQHSQAIQSLFAHIPGLKVVMPSNPYDAKGLMISAIKDPNPVVFIDDRWLYNLEGDVPEEEYVIPIGKAKVTKKGKDLTIVSSSYTSVMVDEAVREIEKEHDIQIETIDLRTIKPLDRETIITSVGKTKKMIVVDGTWKSYGIAAEIIATVAEVITLESPIKRVCLPDAPAPAANSLEKEYYINTEKIKDSIIETLNL